MYLVTYNLDCMVTSNLRRSTYVCVCGMWIHFLPNAKNRDFEPNKKIMT